MMTIQVFTQQELYTVIPVSSAVVPLHNLLQLWSNQLKNNIMNV